MGENQDASPEGTPKSQPQGGADVSGACESGQPAIPPLRDTGDCRLPDVGRIAPGYVADLVVVEGNPLSDIRALENVELVIQGGEVIYNRQVSEALVPILVREGEVMA